VSAHHAARVADRVRRVLAETIQNELRDPRIGFVTLTDVKLSSDLQYAVGYVTVMGRDPQDDSLRALNRAIPFLRRTLARRAGLRHTPRLRFVPDDAVERGARLEQIFEELRAERHERPDDP
jgi:ribosome-binding factor A